VLANPRNMRGIHQRNPTTVPLSLRKVNTRPSLSTRDAVSCVVAIQTRPMIGNLTSTTGPAACSRLRSERGSRKKSWLAKSMLSFMANPRETGRQFMRGRSAAQLAVNAQKRGNCGGITPAEAAPLHGTDGRAISSHVPPEIRCGSGSCRHVNASGHISTNVGNHLHLDSARHYVGLGSLAEVGSVEVHVRSPPESRPRTQRSATD